MGSLEAVSHRRRHDGSRKNDRSAYLLYLQLFFRESSWAFSYPEWFKFHTLKVNRCFEKTAVLCKEQQREFEKAVKDGSVVGLVALGRKVVLQLYLLKPSIEQTLNSLPEPSDSVDRRNIQIIRKEFEEITIISDRYNLLLTDFLDCIPDRFKLVVDGIYKPIWAIISQIWMVRKLMIRNEDEPSYAPFG